MINEIVHRAKSEVHSVGLEVLISGMNVTVKGGSFTVARQDYVLDDDYSYDVPVIEYPHVVEGCLAVHKESNEVVVAVRDRIVGVERESSEDDSYEILFSIYDLVVENGVTDLNDVSVNVRRVIPKEEEAVQ